MISEQEYKKWKPLIEEYEESEAADALANSLYCTDCQAIDFHDCFCDETGSDSLDCATCGGEDDHHYLGCPYNTDPYDNLITNGYD